MGKEIERKFLLANDSWRNAALGTEFMQGYISSSPSCTVRVRIAGKNGWLTVKGVSVNITRSEFEYSIP
ncbi:MAG: CYTH domain-containing protein, partial [Victivallaceae bacterium]